MTKLYSKLRGLDTALRIKLSSRILITHSDSLKAHMFLKTATKVINTNSELNSGYSCILYQS